MQIHTPEVALGSWEHLKYQDLWLRDTNSTDPGSWLALTLPIQDLSTHKLEPLDALISTRL